MFYNSRIIGNIHSPKPYPLIQISCNNKYKYKNLVYVSILFA